MPKTAAIILTYSRPDNVPLMVDSLQRQGCEVIIADDGLLPWDVPAGCKHYTHPRTVIRASTCRNEGAKLAGDDVEYLLFLDDDMVPAPDLVAQHEAVLQRFDVSIGLALREWGNKRTDSRLDAYECERAPLSWMTHAGNLALRKSAFWQVGGFDARTFDGSYAWEDTDLGVRLEIAGRSLVLNYDAQCLHLGLADSERDPARSQVNFERFQAKRAGSKRIFFVYSGHLVSTFDVGRGWDRALRQAGHVVQPYSYHDRIQFYAVAGDAWKQVTGRVMEGPMLVRLATEGAIAEAVDFGPDLVVIISGLVLDRVIFQVFEAMQVPTLLLLTESPYSDEEQTKLLRHVQGVCTNDLSSMRRLQQHNPHVVYLPHSYDPWVHYPRPVGPDYRHDVFFFGTLYPERKALFEKVRWGGIDASISGTYILKDGTVRVFRKTRGGLRTWQPNSELAKHYAGSKVSLSWHRTTADYFAGTVIGQDAYSLGPRAYEIPACGGFMVSDASRPELRDVYGDTVPTFTDARSMVKQVRFWLAHEADRQGMAHEQLAAVESCTFRERYESIVRPEVQRLCP